MNQYFKWPQTSIWSRKNLYYNFKYLHEVDTKQTTMWKKKTRKKKALYENKKAQTKQVKLKKQDQKSNIFLNDYE